MSYTLMFRGMRTSVRTFRRLVKPIQPIHQESNGPHSWKFVRDCIKNGELSKLKRDKVTTDAYNAFAADTSLRYASTLDRILERVFGYVVVPRADGKLVAQIPVPRGTRLVLRPNDFPYFLEKSLEHFVLWSEAGTLNQTTVNSAIAERFSSSRGKTLHFVNPMHLRSVPGVFHVHIIARRS